METNVIFCDGEGVQPLYYSQLENGKYVLIRSTNCHGGVANGYETLTDEYDDMKVYNDAHGPAYIMVKKWTVGNVQIFAQR